MTFTMPRSSWAQQTRIGYEGLTPGTLVACHRRLKNVQFEWAAKPEMGKYRGPGYKVANLVFPNRLWSEFSIKESPLTYDELIFLAAMWLGIQGMGTPPAASGLTWTAQPTIDQQDRPATFSAENGDGTYCDSAACMLLQDLSVKLARPGLSVSGKGIGQLLTPGATPTTTGINLYGTNKAVSNEIKVWTATTYDNLASSATAMADAKSFEFAGTGRWGPNWVLDSDYPSFKGPVELPPTVTAKLKLEHNAQSYNFLNQLYAGGIMWMMVQAYSPIIVTGSTHHQAQIYFPFFVDDAAPPADAEGVWTMEWPLQPTIPPDSDAQFWLQLLLTNGVTAL